MNDEDPASRLRRLEEEYQAVVGIAAHDLQAPLRRIASFLDLLQHRAGELLDDKARHYVEVAIDAASQERELVQDLVRFARIDADGPAADTEVDCAAACRAVLERHGEQMERLGAQAQIGELPKLRCRDELVQELFHRIIDNALAFHHPERPPVLRIDGTAGDDGRGHIMVADNGVGIDADFLPMIGQLGKRQRRPDDSEGGGIGLAICRKIVERRGGALSIRSRPGEGCTVEFTLPLAS